MPTLRPRPPIAPALPTQTNLKEFLDENDALLNAAHTYQKNGQILDAVEYLRRSQTNTVALIRLLQKQRAQEAIPPEELRMEREQLIERAVKAIALKKPPKRRKKVTEPVKVEKSDQGVDNPVPVNNESQATDMEIPSNAALDMPSLF